MKMVCFCEKVHFRFLYTPTSQKTENRKLKTENFILPLSSDINQIIFPL